MMLVSIGDQVEEGIYPFHSRFHRAANFRHGDRLVSVVREEIGDGPLNVVLKDLPERPLRAAGLQRIKSPDVVVGRVPPRGVQDSLLTAGETHGALEISDGKVVFEGRKYLFTDRQRYCSTLESGIASTPRFRHNLSRFGELLQMDSPPKSLAFLLDDRRTREFRSGFERTLAEQVRRSVSQIFFGDRLKGVRALSGCGLGLTPSGDDFIAGLLIGLNLRGTAFRGLAREIFAAARSDNIFSNTFLDLARRGLLFGRMKSLIWALGSDSEDAVRQAAERLFAVGGSSGADLGTGFFMTLRNGFGAS
jgi:hypothetical protein